jgi:hypothetical protein
VKILLDYFFPITAITPTAQASTSFLKQVLVLVKPKVGVPANIVSATSMSTVTPLTDNTEITQLFNAGMSRVFVLPKADLDLDTILAGASDFFTILVSSDFSAAEITAADFGVFKGVVGVSNTDETFLTTQAAIENRVAFHSTSTNKAKNMFYAFGKLLSNALAWRNQQYIAMPFADDIDELGEANNLFDKKISFVISDSEYGQRLGLFTVGGKAIVAPYIERNLTIDMQSQALSYISANQPNYTLKHAALIEDELDKVVKAYVADDLIEFGDVQVTLEEDNFVAAGKILITEPKALWRIFAEMRQTT